MSNRTKPHGVIPAIVTPMNEDGSLNRHLLEKQTQYLLDAGVNGLFVCGGTGEGAYLTAEEKKETYEIIRNVTGDKIFICLAVIASNTSAVLREFEVLKNCDADYLVATAPYYHAANQRDIYEHYKLIAENAFAPLLVYNIPSATHNMIELETIKKLSEVNNIIGIKDSSGNFMHFSRGLFGGGREDFAWIQGEDYLCGPSLLCGADGMVTGLGNARIEPYVEMYAASLQGDTERVKACQAKVNVLYKIIHAFGNGNASIKGVTELYDRGIRWMRQKSFSLTDEQITVIRNIMQEYEKI